MKLIMFRLEVENRVYICIFLLVGLDKMNIVLLINVIFDLNKFKQIDDGQLFVDKKKLYIHNDLCIKIPN